MMDMEHAMMETLEGTFTDLSPRQRLVFGPVASKFKSDRTAAILSLKPLVGPPPLPKGPLTMDGLVIAVAHVCQTTVADIRSVSRFATHVRARHIFFWCCRQWLPNDYVADSPQGTLSFPQIAHFTNRDHTTVIYGVRKVSANIDPYQDDISAVAAIVVKKEELKP